MLFFCKIFHFRLLTVMLTIIYIYFLFFFLLVSPESIVIPILSCILGFPLLALLVICCLRRRAKLARERDRRRNYDLQDHAVGLVRISNIHRLSEYSCPCAHPLGFLTGYPLPNTHPCESLYT